MELGAHACHSLSIFVLGCAFSSYLEESMELEG